MDLVFTYEELEEYAPLLDLDALNWLQEVLEKTLPLYDVGNWLALTYLVQMWQDDKARKSMR